MKKHINKILFCIAVICLLLGASMYLMMNSSFLLPIPSFVSIFNVHGACTKTLFYHGRIFKNIQGRVIYINNGVLFVQLTENAYRLRCQFLADDKSMDFRINSNDKIPILFGLRTNTSQCYTKVVSESSDEIILNALYEDHLYIYRLSFPSSCLLVSSEISNHSRTNQ